MRAISVVVVCYNSAATIEACLNSIPADAEVVVVDQASGDRSAEAAASARPDALVVKAGVNRGFGSGCNLGAAHASGAVIIFLNPDAMLAGDAAPRLADALCDPTVGVVGPQLRDADGNTITKCRRWGSPWRDTVNLLLPERILPKAWRRDVPRDAAVYLNGGRVDYVQGACMAINAETFRHVGGFDEEFFLYSEEESLSYRLRALGRFTRVEPAAIVVHVGQRSTAPTGDFAVRQLFRSRAIWYQKRYGALRGLAGAVFVAMGLGALLLTAPLRRVVRVRQDEDAGFCRTALAGLADGMVRRRVAALPSRRGQD